MKFLFAFVTLLAASSAYAGDRVKYVVTSCTELSPPYDVIVDQLIDEGYKLISVILLDTPPQPMPGDVQRQCSYIFVKQ